MKNFPIILVVIISNFFICETTFSKPLKYPLEMVWDYNMSHKARNEIISSPLINTELRSVFELMSIDKCDRALDGKKCRQNPPKPTLIDIFDYIDVATPDLNNDGRRDLILKMGPQTGLAGMSRCAISDVWFYENIGGNYRNIGKDEFLVSDQILLGVPKIKGKYRDLVTKSYDEFCLGKRPPRYFNYKYNYKKNAYFDLERPHH